MLSQQGLTMKKIILLSTIVLHCLALLLSKQRLCLSLLYVWAEQHFNHGRELVSPNIVIKNGKIVWKHGPFCWYFCLNVKYLGWPYRAYIKTVKNGNFCEELLSENGFEAVLATFYCYDHGAKASEAVQKIAADQKEYRKCSLCAVIC